MSLITRLRRSAAETSPADPADHPTPAPTDPGGSAPAVDPTPPRADADQPAGPRPPADNRTDERRSTAPGAGLRTIPAPYVAVVKPDMLAF